MQLRKCKEESSNVCLLIADTSRSVSTGLAVSEQCVGTESYQIFHRVFDVLKLLFQFLSQTCLVLRLFSGEIEQNYGNFSLSAMNGDISLLAQNCARDAFHHISLSPHRNGHIFSPEILSLKTSVWPNKAMNHYKLLTISTFAISELVIYIFRLEYLFL